MTDLRKVAQHALEALESADVDPHSSDAVYKAITALKAAKAEPVQEPVAYRYSVQPQVIGPSVWAFSETNDTGDAQPLYTAPPQRKPLTEEEIYSLFRTAGSPTAFACAIERAHGIT